MTFAFCPGTEGATLMAEPPTVTELVRAAGIFVERYVNATNRSVLLDQ